MMARRAPDGCLQYFTGDRGAMASFNFDGSSAMSPDQDYSICFKSSPEICAVALQAEVFDLGRDQQRCRGGFWGTFGAVGEDGQDLGRDRFCGTSFGDENGKMVSFQKPFVFRVKAGAEPSPGRSGFLIIYNLMKC